MKLKSIRRGSGVAREKPTEAVRWADARRLGDERPQRVWSLLLPPAYFSERR
jgi:hypothetical protein